MPHISSSASTEDARRCFVSTFHGLVIMLETFADTESFAAEDLELNLLHLIDSTSEDTLGAQLDRVKTPHTPNSPQLPQLEILNDSQITFLPSIETPVESRDSKVLKQPAAEDTMWASRFCLPYAPESLPMETLQGGTTLTPSERLEWVNVVKSMAECIAKEDKEAMAKIMQAMKLCRTKELAFLIAGAAKALRWQGSGITDTATTSSAQLEVTLSDLSAF